LCKPHACHLQESTGLKRSGSRRNDGISSWSTRRLSSTGGKDFTEFHGQEVVIPIVYTVEIRNWGGTQYNGVCISPSVVVAL